MSSLFSKPKMPKVKDIPVPAKTDREVAAAAEEERRRQYAARGSGTSWLTGGMGVPGGATQSAGAKLLSGR